MIYLALIYAFVCIVIGRQFAYNDVLRLGRTQQRTPPEKYQHRDIEFFGEGGVLLKGWFFENKQSVDNETVIVLHGWLNNRDQVLDQALGFVEQGFHVLAYDQRSHGGSNDGFITFGKNEGLDLLHAVDFLRYKTCANPEKLGLVGFSLGACASIYATARQAQVFKAMILEGVLGDSYLVTDRALRRVVGRLGALFIGYIILWPGSQFWSLFRFRRAKVASEAKKLGDTPVMVVRGEQDYWVSEDNAKLLLAAIPNLAELWQHSQGHINAFQSFPREYQQRTSSFLARYLKSPEPATADTFPTFPKCSDSGEVSSR